MNKEQQVNTPKKLGKETVKMVGEQRSHERKFFRLKTASWAIKYSIIAIVFLAFISAASSFYSTYAGCECLVDGENIRSAIFSLSSIVTLALGFIAGSNIES